MTREEAIAVLAESKRQNEVMRDNPSTFWASHQMADGVKNAERRIAALELVLTALCPVSREQLEKVWSGEWVKCKHADYYVCNKCSTVSKTGEDEFCKSCGAPMTDKAMQMVMERLEEMKNG